MPADLILLTQPWAGMSQQIDPAFHGASRPAWDPNFQFFASRKLLSDSLAHGNLPLWNAHALCGTPFVGDGQSAVFYPLNWLFAVISLTWAFGLAAALHTFLAGLFTYIYGRTLGWRPTSAFIAGVLWMCSGVMVAWQMWQVVDATLCWFPLALAGWEEFRHTDHPLWAAGASAALGVSLLAGHMQFAFYGLCIAIGYMLARRSSRTKWLTHIATVGGIALGTLLLASVQLIPTADLLLHSPRLNPSLGELLATAMPWHQLVMLLTPELLGGVRDMYVHPYVGQAGSNYYELTCFVGGTGLTLAIVGLMAKQTACRWFWATLLIVGVLVGCGTALYVALYHVLPLFKSFHGVGRALSIAQFSIAILAGWGAEHLSANSDGTRKAVKISVGIALALLLIGYRCAVTGGGDDVTNLLTHEWLAYGVVQLLIAAAAIGFVALIPMAGATWRGFLAALLIVAQSLLFAVGVNTSVSRADAFPTTPAVTFLRDHASEGRVLSLGDNHPDHAQSRWVPNTAMALGLDDVSGSEPLSLLSYYTAQSAMNRSASGSDWPAGVGTLVSCQPNQINLLNTGYVISPIPVSKAGLVLVFGDGVLIYRNDESRGWAWLDHSDDWSVASGGATLPNAVSENAPEHVTVNRPSSGRIVADVTAERPGALIVSEAYDDGWRATDHGKPIRLFQAYGVLTAVPLIAGSHNVELSYLPSSIRLGIYLSCLAWTVFAFLVGGEIAKRTMRAKSR
jgi:hypothetical protein